MDDNNADTNKSTGVASEVLSTKNPCAEQISDKIVHGTPGCPMCGAPEIEANTPRTVYACGSSDYDQRPQTFNQSDECKSDPVGFAYSTMVKYIGATPEEFGLISWQAMRDKMKQELRLILDRIESKNFIDSQEYMDNIH